MSSETWAVVAAGVVAVVALVAVLGVSVVLVRLRAEVRGLREHRATGPEPVSRPSPPAPTATEADHVPQAAVHVGQPLAPQELVAARRLPDEHTVVTREGRVVVLPSDQQVVAATMGRPLIRGAVISHGLLYALRPESRDRIRGIVRREFRRRRRIRSRAARAAARSVRIGAPPQPTWLGTDTGEQEGRG